MPFNIRKMLLYIVVLVSSGFGVDHLVMSINCDSIANVGLRVESSIFPASI